MCSAIYRPAGQTCWRPSRESWSFSHKPKSLNECCNLLQLSGENKTGIPVHVSQNRTQTIAKSFNVGRSCRPNNRQLRWQAYIILRFKLELNLHVFYCQESMTRASQGVESQLNNSARGSQTVGWRIGCLYGCHCLLASWNCCYISSPYDWLIIRKFITRA